MHNVQRTINHDPVCFVRGKYNARMRAAGEGDKHNRSGMNRHKGKKENILG